MLLLVELLSCDNVIILHRRSVCSYAVVGTHWPNRYFLALDNWQDGGKPKQPTLLKWIMSPTVKGSQMSYTRARRPCREFKMQVGAHWHCVPYVMRLAADTRLSVFSCYRLHIRDPLKGLQKKRKKEQGTCEARWSEKGWACPDFMLVSQVIWSVAQE